LGIKARFTVYIKLPTWFPIATATAATISAATAATAIASAAATTTATAKPTTAATITPILPGSGFVHRQITSIEFLAIKLRDGSLPFFFCSHFNKAKAPGTSGFTVFNDRRGFYRPRLGKQLVQILAGSLESEITNIEFHRHVNAPLPYLQECERSFNRSGLRCNGSSESASSDAQDERLL
jgi:hypothetical protein